MPEQQERVVELVLDSNEVVYVRRLSPLAQQVLMERAKQLFPTPDAKEYEQPLSEIASNALEGVMVPGEQNPKYILVVRDVRLKQNGWVLDQFLNMDVVVNTPEGREATIARYADRIAALREYGELPEDAWKATVRYGLMTSWDDRNRIGNAATGMLSGEEIRLALVTFR